MKKKFFNFGKTEGRANHDVDPSMLLQLLKSIWRNIKAIGPYFLIGIILSVLFQRFTTLFGGNETWVC